MQPNQPKKLPSLFIACITALLAPVNAKSPEEFVGPPPPAQTAPAKAAPGRAADSTAPARRQAPAAIPPSPSGAAAAAPARPAGKAASLQPAGSAAAGSSAKAPASGPAAAASKPALDTARIHSIYLDGDFEQALRILEGVLKAKTPLTQADSVFIFKHLGVMYAATPNTREKGRYYMLQLISIEPTAKILDMYASDMIYLIFRNVQEEYESKRGKSAGPAAAAGDTASAPAARAPIATAAVPAATSARSAESKRTLYWAAGGAAVAAGAAGLLFILLDDPQPKKRNIVLKE